MHSGGVGCEVIYGIRVWVIHVHYACLVHIELQVVSAGVLLEGGLDLLSDIGAAIGASLLLWSSSRSLCFPELSDRNSAGRNLTEGGCERVLFMLTPVVSTSSTPHTS